MRKQRFGFKEILTFFFKASNKSSLNLLRIASDESLRKMSFDLMGKSEPTTAAELPKEETKEDIKEEAERPTLESHHPEVVDGEEESKKITIFCWFLISNFFFQIRVEF